MERASSVKYASSLGAVPQHGSLHPVVLVGAGDAGRGVTSLSELREAIECTEPLGADGHWWALVGVAVPARGNDRLEVLQAFW